MEKDENKQIVKQQITIGNRGLQLNSLEDMYRFGQYVIKSGLAPDSYQTSEQVLIAIQTGAEINLSPMQSLNSFAVIHGKPTMYGDAALALVKRSGLLHSFSEKVTGEGDSMVAFVESVRKDGELSNKVVSIFSVADAKTAGLWGKKGPWCTHPKRMLKYKARAFNLRDNFPDVLFGMHITEEMVGEEPLPAPESDVPPRDERRLAVPSSAVDTTRKPVEETEGVPLSLDGPCGGAAPIREVETEPEVYLPNSRVKRIVPDDESTAEPAKEEKPVDVKDLYIEVNALYVEKGGEDFVAFVAFVLCVDEDEVGPDKLNDEQLKQIKAYIETSGVEIS